MTDPKLAEALSINDQRALDRMIDDDIDFMEHGHLEFVPPCIEGLCIPDEE